MATGAWGRRLIKIPFLSCKQYYGNWIQNLYIKWIQWIKFTLFQLVPLSSLWRIRVQKLTCRISFFDKRICVWFTRISICYQSIDRPQGCPPLRRTEDHIVFRPIYGKVQRAAWERFFDDLLWYYSNKRRISLFIFISAAKCCVYLRAALNRIMLRKYASK